jgi:Flp pilus assembly protein TadD
MKCRLGLWKPRTVAQKQAARELLDELAGQRGATREIALFLGEGYASLRDHDRALEFVRRARRADREDWQAIGLEARIHLAAGRHAEAANCAIESLSLIYLQPRLYYTLALALRHLGEESRAVDCLRVAMRQAPTFAAPYEELARILRGQRNFGEAALHFAKAAALRKRTKKVRGGVGSSAEEPAQPVVAFERSTGAPVDRSRVVTIVSGLPRSGTSMTMQMLVAGGMEAYTDLRRAADKDNPFGYFEHENAARLREESAWIAEARSKAVKIVANLLPYLPPGEEYRIILMHRNLNEVVASQRAMLMRLGRAGGRVDDRVLARTFTRQMVQVQTWLAARPEIQVLSVNYADVVGNPGAAAARLRQFLGEPFDAARAAAAVNPSLQRQGSETGYLP